MNVNQLLDKPIFPGITLRAIFTLAKEKYGFASVDDTTEAAVMMAGENLLAAIIDSGGITPLGPMKTYVPREGLWRLADEATRFTRRELDVILSGMPDNEFVEAQMDGFLDTIHEKAGKLYGAEALVGVRYRFQQESARTVALYVELNLEHQVMFDVIDLYVTNGISLPGYYSHIGIVERRRKNKEYQLA